MTTAQVPAQRAAPAHLNDRAGPLLAHYCDLPVAHNAKVLAAADYIPDGRQVSLRQCAKQRGATHLPVLMKRRAAHTARAELSGKGRHAIK